MRSPQRILLAHDFSDAAADAMEEAALLARTFGAELTFVHAVPEASEDTPEFDGIAHPAEDLLRTLRQRLTSDGVDVSANLVVRSGSPARLLLEVARDLAADLLVLGAGAKTALDRILLGSTAEQVVRAAPCPVWLTRPGRRHQRVERILCAQDTGHPCPEALAEAATLAEALGARLVLLSLAPPQAGGRGGSLGEREAALRRMLDAAATDHGFDRSRGEVVVREGRPALGILEAVHERRCELAVLGCSGREGLRRLVLGNTAEEVLRQVPCSLLTVRHHA